MPSAFSAKDNPALMATCVACHKKTPTASMVNLTDSDNGRGATFAICLACGSKGWRPPGFRGLYQRFQ